MLGNYILYGSRNPRFFFLIVCFPNTAHWAVLTGQKRWFSWPLPLCRTSFVLFNYLKHDIGVWNPTRNYYFVPLNSAGNLHFPLTGGSTRSFMRETKTNFIRVLDIVSDYLLFFIFPSSSYLQFQNSSREQKGDIHFKERSCLGGPLSRIIFRVSGICSANLHSALRC